MRSRQPPPVRVVTDAAEVMQPGTGAVIVFFGPRQRPGRMLLYAGPYLSSAMIEEWTLAGRPYWCAVLPNIPPGEATLSRMWVTPPRFTPVLVEAGTVTRVDWRRGATVPRTATTPTPGSPSPATHGIVAPSGGGT